jgi:hypothetical protein
MARQRLRQLALLAATVVVVTGACTVGADVTLGPTSSDPVSPSEAAATDAPQNCPNFVDVVETGPEPTDVSENGPIPRAQARLSNDVEAAVAYGAEHPDDFASVRFENAPRVRIVIGFTERIDVHCAALRAMLEYPEEFEIIQQPRTARDLEEIQREIVALAGPRMRAVGIGAGTIDASLRADGQAIAEQIRAKYGDLVTIQVGLQPYPRGSGPSADCGARLGPVVTETPFTATLRLASSTVRSGEDFKATASVTNGGTSPVEFESGDPMTAFIYRAGTDEIVGTYDGGIDGVGLGGTLAPGESIDVGVLGGTASCLAELGYALPPGTYDVRAAIDQYEHPPDGDVIISYLLTAPVPLTVTP